MIRCYFFGIIFLLIGFNGSGQINGGLGNMQISDKISIGGNFGLNFSSITYINLSPTIGYKLTDQLTAGVGFIYQYVEYDKEIYGFEFKTSTYGGSLFARYRFLENFYATGEFQNLNMDTYDLNLNQRGRMNIPILFVGGGYLQSIGGKAYVSLSLLYDVLENRYSPYQNPVIQGGIVVNP